MTSLATSSFNVRTSVDATTTLLSSPLYASSHRAGNYDGRGGDNNNILPSIMLHSSGRPITSTDEKHLSSTTELCQQTTTTVEIHTNGARGKDVVVRAAVRSRPVTACRTRASVRGRTVSVPLWRPLNSDIASDRRLIPPITTSAAPSLVAKVDLDQVDEFGGPGDFDDIHEITMVSSSPKTHDDNGGRACAVATSGSCAAAAISISIGADTRRMSHVTPDFDPPPPMRRFDPSPLGVATHQQVRANTTRQIHVDDRRSMLRSSRSRDAADAAADKGWLVGLMDRDITGTLNTVVSQILFKN